MKKNKFTSYVFSCLGVAACVSLYSCGGNKEKNEKEKLLQDYVAAFKKANNGTISDDQKKKLSDFVDAKLEAKKKNKETNLAFNNNEFSSFCQQTSKLTETPKTITTSKLTETPKPATTHKTEETSKPAAPSTSTETPKTDSLNDGKIYELLKDKKTHSVLKVGNYVFDLNVFYDLYSWAYKKANNQKGLVDPQDLTLKHIKNILSKGGFAQNQYLSNEEKNFGIKSAVSNKWTDENTIYTYDFTASLNKEGREKLECPSYNGLVKFLLSRNDCGFSGDMFNDGKLNRESATLDENNGSSKLNNLIQKLTL